jgi:glycosyltransferase involved in cell wall biosynthesis
MPHSLVDVVIPTFDRTTSLKRAVESALNQGELINKIIVIDDGSSISTINYLKSNIVTLPKTEVIFHHRVGNPGLIRNAGIKNSKSSFIAFLDSDDFWLPGKIELQLRQFYKHNELEIVCSNARIYKDVIVKNRYFNRDSGYISKLQLYKKNWIITSSVLIKTASIKKVNGIIENQDLQGLEDYFTWLILIGKRNTFYMKECLVGYTFSEDSHSKLKLFSTLDLMIAFRKIFTIRQRIFFFLVLIPGILKKILFEFLKQVFQVRLKVLESLRNESFIRQRLYAFTTNLQTRRFQNHNLNFSPTIQGILQRKRPFNDKYLLKRNPALEFVEVEGRKVVSLDKNYNPKDEIRIDNRPYEALFKTIVSIPEFTNANSLIDVGCSTGNLLSLFQQSIFNLDVYGIEVFQFLKDAAPQSIRNKIFIEDLRFNFTNKIPVSELVICLEVAEHIDPNSLDNFLENLKCISSKYLVMSWSSSYPPKGAPPQHLSPLSLKDYRRLMSSLGFHEDKQLTTKLQNAAKREPFFQNLWLASITVWVTTKEVSI